MKTATFAISSAALFYLASAFPLSPRQAQQVNIVVQSGDGDSSESFDININTIVPTSQSGGSSGVSAAAGAPGITCQAFSDAAGATPLDGPFSAAPVFFNNCAANGQATSCVLADAVPIGAFCCADDASFNTTCLAKANSGGNSGGKTITVELQGANELAIQISVPDNGSLVVIGGNQQFDSAFIVDGAGESSVSCQAFSDVNGTKKVGGPIGTADVSLDGGKETLVQAISCKAN